MSGWLMWLLDLLFPPKCMICLRLLESSEQRVCERCLQELPEFDGPLRKVDYFEKTVAPLYYEDNVREAVLRFKFQGMSSYGEQFAKWMAIWVRDQLVDQYDLITWVPCSNRRRWTRGYDQAELLAKALAKELHADVFRTLEKTVHNRKQSRQKSAAHRRANVLGVYRAFHPERFQGKKILLVDDVLTTGATLSECGKVLRIAGSGELVCAVIAVVRQENKE